MQLQLMTATVKLFLKKPVEKPQQLIQLVLTYATQVGYLHLLNAAGLQGCTACAHLRRAVGLPRLKPVPAALLASVHATLLTRLGPCGGAPALQETDNPDLRDRAYIYWRLLSTDPGACDAEHPKRRRCPCFAAHGLACCWRLPSDVPFWHA